MKGTSTKTSPGARPQGPCKAFQFSLMTWEGPVWQIQWSRNRLIYRRSPLMRSTTQITSHQPDDAAWNHFWESLEEIGTWTWRKVYDVPVDWGGTNWVLSICTSRRTFYVTGANRFPPRFPDFLKALGVLVGDLELGGDLQKMIDETQTAAPETNEKKTEGIPHPL